MYRESRSRVLIEFLFFTFIVSATSHLLFSWMGYNPTDDGFTLAYSRRILEGQIPHRDFIIIRPFLSPLLHTPFVLWGGEYTFWLSRFFVWFQFACIAWIWTFIINGFLGKPFNTIERNLVSLITFVLSANVFPIIAWHTIDGLFLFSIGLALCLSKNRIGISAGYVLIAMAYLCKQSFIPAAPLVICILGNRRKIKYWIAIAVPGILYVLFMLFTGALSDAILQLGSQHGILSVGVKSYLTNWMTLLGVLIGYFLVRLAVGNPPVNTPLDKSLQKKSALALLFLTPTSAAALSMFPYWFYNLYQVSFGLFGMVIGVFLYFALEDFEDRARKKKIRITLLALLTAWSTSLSLGYNSPVLASGLLVTLLITYALSHVTRKPIRFSLILLAVALNTSAFVTARHSIIYREQPAKNLTYPLGTVLRGGNYIKTNVNTYEFLADLRKAVDLAVNNGSAYTIIPDNAGYWVKSRQPNPISIDWVQGTELNNPLLLDRIVADLESRRGDLIIITQKVRASTLALGFDPLPETNHYAIVVYVRSHFKKFAETRFFELYK